MRLRTDSSRETPAHPRPGLDACTPDGHMSGYRLTGAPLAREAAPSGDAAGLLTRVRNAEFRLRRLPPCGRAMAPRLADVKRARDAGGARGVGCGPYVAIWEA